ncbi:trehalose-phosphatase [Georgenia halophila]|uniref:Trehalose 6-phosphate phosphatase n=1 Tax=Georgenia halophila TaxID=620889 RepID=A0ABP8KS71_9MICO
MSHSATGPQPTDADRSAAEPGQVDAGARGRVDGGVPGPGVDAPLFSARLRPDLDEALEAFAARGRLLVGLDFDGVLAPIVVDPTTSRMLPASADAVARLSALPDVEVVLVSGRDAEDLAALAGLPTGSRVVGSHGAQWGRVVTTPGGGAGLESDGVELSESQAGLKAELLRETEALADGVDGAWVHAKPAAVVLHTRPADPAAAEALTERVLAGPAARDGVHVLVGKQVVEMAVLEVTKGDAMVQLRQSLDVDAALYIGDDTTDEDAFVVLDATAHDLTIKVGEGPTAAAYRVTDPDEASAVLLRLVELLEASRSPAGHEQDSRSSPEV